MPLESTKVVSTRSSTSHLRGRSSKGKDQSRSLTSECIAADVATFRKQGGHIEVLGITPIRERVNVTASRAKGNTQRQPPTAATAAKTATP
ncbi:MAG: hypothetical protein ACOH1R_09180 [Luteimonas sp.]